MLLIALQEAFFSQAKQGVHSTVKGMPTRPSLLSSRQIVQGEIERLKRTEAYNSLALVFETVADHVQDEPVLAQLQDLICLFPIAESEAFWFDVTLLRQITNEWHSQGLPLSPNLIPIYRPGWSYTRGQIEVLASVMVGLGQEPSLHFVTLNRTEEAALPYLLDYPWLYHELAHYAMRVADNPFVQAFTDLYDAYLLQLELAQLSYRNRARTSAEETLQRLTAYWKLNVDHNNWAHEIAMDTIALYTCGPAYLTAFSSDMRITAGNAFGIVQSHPPTFYRTKALIRTAEKLGWSSYVQDPVDLLHHFEKGSTSVELANLAASYAPNELVFGAVEAALEYCKATHLPQFTHERLDEINRALANDELLRGTDLIVAAWLVATENREPYDAWEKRTFAKVMEPAPSE